MQTVETISSHAVAFWQIVRKVLENPKSTAAEKSFNKVYHEVTRPWIYFLGLSQNNGSPCFRIAWLPLIKCIFKTAALKFVTLEAPLKWAKHFQSSSITNIILISGIIKWIHKWANIKLLELECAHIFIFIEDNKF